MGSAKPVTHKAPGEWKVIRFDPTTPFSLDQEPLTLKGTFTMTLGKTQVISEIVTLLIVLILLL